jgi:hypothetical protein
MSCCDPKPAAAAAAAVINHVAFSAIPASLRRTWEVEVSQAPVNELQLPLVVVYQHISWLDVSVHDAFAMCVVQRHQQLHISNRRSRTNVKLAAVQMTSAGISCKHMSYMALGNSNLAICKQRHLLMAVHALQHARPDFTCTQSHADLDAARQAEWQLAGCCWLPQGPGSTWLA